MKHKVGESLFATVFFFDGYVQIATCTGGVEIGDLKSTLWERQTDKSRSHSAE